MAVRRSPREGRFSSPTGSDGSLWRCLHSDPYAHSRTMRTAPFEVRGLPRRYWPGAGGFPSDEHKKSERECSGDHGSKRERPDVVRPGQERDEYCRDKHCPEKDRKNRRSQIVPHGVFHDAQL